MPNRLASEVSPYLQQHAENPVDWFPWGAEALEKAKREEKPILLSIGYSACHWCHVMERESFENEAIADLMNERFVNVKVDREERPDLDHLYQLVVQIMGRSGGWPLTVFLTPDQQPFFGGTYFPPADRHGMPGFPKVLQAVWDAYRARPGDVGVQASEIAQAIEGMSSSEGEPSDGAIGPELLTEAAKELVASFDEENGGFGRRPKFPNAMSLSLLLRSGDVTRVEKALRAMRSGGIWDHLAGGFHRYSTDERWLVPHFEKMLYDNAQLLRLYADAWRVTGKALYASTARSIAAYVLGEMTSPDGGFYATQDADSDGEEGKFFVWTPREIDEACAGDAEAARVAKAAYDVTDEGNFERTGATVLSTPAPIEGVAEAVSMPRGEAEAALERARVRMLAVRRTRVAPLRDEKVVASWNGLMAGALANAGAALGEGAWIEAAARALGFVERTLVVPGGRAGASAGATGRTRLMRHVTDGVVRGPGFLDDHAFVGDAALDLYEATGEARWVDLARRLGDTILAHFHDAANDGFFFTADDGEKLLVRAKDSFDQAVPSGSSVACRLLLRLGTLVDARYAAPAERTVEKLARSAATSPLGMSVTLGLADRLVRGSVDVVVVGPRASKATQSLLHQAQRAYAPDLVLAHIDPANPVSLDAVRALGEGKTAEAEPVAYVCRGRTCSLPIRDASELARAISG